MFIFLALIMLFSHACSFTSMWREATTICPYQWWCFHICTITKYRTFAFWVATDSTYSVTVIHIRIIVFHLKAKQASSSTKPALSLTVIIQSYSAMNIFPLTSVAKLLCVPSRQFGISKVDVWHHGFKASSFSIVLAKHSDQPLRGKAAQVVEIKSVWIKFARLTSRSKPRKRDREDVLTGRHYLPNEKRSYGKTLNYAKKFMRDLPSIVASWRTWPIIVMFPLQIIH